MNVSVIVIGDELLIGQVTDTNSGFLARTMAPEGWEVTDIQVIADSAEEIRRAVETAMSRSQVVLTTGGLGPTKDDITKQTLCDIFGGSLREDPAVSRNIEEVFAKRGLKLNALTAAQAMVPTSARIIQNRVGTAPVMWFERTDKRGNKHVLVAMPGVPFETEHVFAHEVFPRLLEAFPRHDALTHRTIMVTDITESDLATRLAPWEAALDPRMHLAYLPKPGIIRLRLDAHGTDAASLEHEADAAEEELIGLCGDKFLCRGDRTPAELLVERLTERGLHVATAESCTGGNIAHRITSVAGSSAAMVGGIVAYSNDVKRRLLGVEASTLDTYGAVSIAVVEQMALGACRLTGADIAMATSGIAGPGGGSEEKPVGTVCIAVAASDGTVRSHTYHFPGNRSRVIDRASTTALLMAIELIASTSA